MLVFELKFLSHIIYKKIPFAENYMNNKNALFIIVHSIKYREIPNGKITHTLRKPWFFHIAMISVRP